MEYVVQEGITINEEKPYRIRLISVDEFDEYVRFTFDFVDEEIDQTISGVCKAKLAPGNRLHKWLSVFSGGNLEVGDSVNPEAYVGNTVEAVIKKRLKDGIEYLNVVDIVS